MKVRAAMFSPDKQPDRRRHIRYLVNGSLEFEVRGKLYTGVPKNLGMGGLLFQAVEVPPEGAAGTMRLVIRGFDERIVAKARIIRTHETAAAAIFLTSSAALGRCVAWRAQKELGKQARAATALTAEIAERKQVEEKLRQSEEEFLELLENAPDAMVIVNGQGRIVRLNKQADQLFGYDREELLGRPVEALVPERFRSTHQTHCRDYMVSPSVRKMGTQMEICALRKDGTEVPVEVSLAPLKTAEGPVISAAIRDITERKQMELQLSRSHRMEAVGRLAGGVAHDFNNHLGIIIGYSERLLQRLGSGDPLRRHVGMIKEAALRSATLTQQLLAFGRRQVLEPRILDLNAVVSELTKMLRPLIGENIELVTSLDPPLGKVKADPAQIDQVIMNLAVNARDAMPQGGRLTIETADVELDEGYAGRHATVVPGPYVMLAVTDTGIGMDRETQDHIYEPFYTTKEQAKGTGLGLATVYGIVKQSGGYIWVYSEPGQGATFKIYLPRVEKDIPKANTEQVPYPTLHGAETVLVVEDEGILRELACEFLRGGGYQVLDSSNGAEAIQISGKHPGPIHLLLTDGVMPGMSGRQLAKHLLDARVGLKVLYMSGYTDDVVLRNGMLESDMAFLQKPFTRDCLLLRVRQVLDGKQRGEEEGKECRLESS